MAQRGDSQFDLVWDMLLELVIYQALTSHHLCESIPAIAVFESSIKIDADIIFDGQIKAGNSHPATVIDGQYLTQSGI